MNYYSLCTKHFSFSRSTMYHELLTKLEKVSEKEMSVGVSTHCMTVYGQTMSDKIFVSVTEDRKSD